MIFLQGAAYPTNYELPRLPPLFQGSTLTHL
jgi:hypothetical protein